MYDTAIEGKLINEENDALKYDNIYDKIDNDLIYIYIIINFLSMVQIKNVIKHKKG